MLALILAVCVAHPLPKHTGQPVPVGLVEIDFELYRMTWVDADRCTIEPDKPGGEGWKGNGSFTAGMLRLHWHYRGGSYLAEYRPDVETPGVWSGTFYPVLPGYSPIPSRIKPGAGR